MRAAFLLLIFGLVTCSGANPSGDDAGSPAPDACVAETDKAFCKSRNANCGEIPDFDDCDAWRVTGCGICDAPACVCIDHTKIEKACLDSADNDDDDSIDCADSDCVGELVCDERPPGCQDGLDNDFDGKTDCQEPACTTEACCMTPEVCNNSKDDDCDKKVDCADPNCATDPHCTGEGEICGNNVDDDGNGTTDCDDAACFGAPGC